MSSKSGNADMACMDNGHVKGYRRENVEDWRAAGKTCLQSGRDALCLLLRQHAASLSPAWPSFHTPLNSSEGSLLKGFFKEPGTVT